MLTRPVVSLIFFLALFIAVNGLSHAQLVTLWETQVGGSEIDDFRALTQLSNGDIVASANGDNGIEFFRYDFEEGTLVDRIAMPQVVTGAPLTALDGGNLLIGIDIPGTSNLPSTWGVYDPDQGFIWIRELGGRFTHLNPISGNRYISAGTVSNMQFREHVVAILDSVGNTLQWGYMGSLHETAVEAIETSTGAFASVGVIDNGDINVHFLTPEGDLWFDTVISDYAAGPPVVDGIIQEADGNLMLYGSFPVNDDLTRSFIRLSPDGDVLTHMGDWPNPVLLMPHGGYLSYKAQGDGGVMMQCWDMNYQHRHWLDQYTVAGSLTNPGQDHSQMVISPSDELILAGSYYMGPDEEQEAYIVKFRSIPNDLVVRARARQSGSTIEPPGMLNWYGALINTLDNDMHTDVWLLARMPNGYPTEPLRMWEDVTITGAENIIRQMHQPIPATAPPGEYVYILRTGNYPLAAQQACFTFMVHDASQADSPSNPAAGEAWPEFNVLPRTTR